MPKIFVSNSPNQLSDSELAGHATRLSSYIQGNRIVGLLMVVAGGILALQFSTLDAYSIFCGLGGGFLAAQGRLSVLAERINRLEKQLEQ